MSQASPTASVGLPQHEQAALRLPSDVVKSICDQVDNRTIKNLRATCRYYSQTALLRLDRVFISANPRNVETFIAIARHEKFRHQITEIIWDDVTLYEGPRRYRGEDAEAYLEDSNHEDYNDDSDEAEDDEGETDDGINTTGKDLKWYCGENEFGIDWTGNIPKWYRKECKKSIFELMSALGDDLDRPDHLARAEQLASHMPVKEAWAYYQDLLKQQREVLDSKAHIKALEDYIDSFPALRRITITPATYGRLFSPLYYTPMIRAFPRGFNFPIPRGWPVVDHYQPDCPEWEDDGSDWQGFRVVTRLLAEHKDVGRVTDLRVDAYQLQTGLNSVVFESENDTFRHFEKMLARPNFIHLHLDLMVDPYERQAEVFQRGLLKRALAGAADGKGLEYLSIGTNIDLGGADGCDDFYVPLDTIFDPAAFSRIQQFGLSRFYVRDYDLLILLRSLPQTLRTMEVNLLEFMDGDGNFREFLNQVRNELGWQGRAIRPSLRLSVQTDMVERLRQIWLDDDLDNFLYKGGKNPFGDDADHPPNLVMRGFGYIKDAFMPEYQRPYVDQQM